MSVSLPTSPIVSLLSRADDVATSSDVTQTLAARYASLAAATTGTFNYELVYTDANSFGAYYDYIDTGIRAALDYWGQFIAADPNALISVEINYTPQEGNVLASAGSPFYDVVASYDGLPVYKSIVESELQSGTDTNAEAADAVINIETMDLSSWWFDSTPDIRWDNEPTPGLYDFTGVILHEFGHALGFNTFYDYPAADTLQTSADAFTVFDTFLGWDTTLNSTGQYEYTNFYFSGSNANAVYTAMGGTGPVPIYAEPGQAGSSLAHYDGVTGNNSLLSGFLMNPSVSAGTLLDVSTLDLAFLQDLGYTLADPSTVPSEPEPEEGPFTLVTAEDSAEELLGLITTSTSGIEIDTSSIQLIAGEGAVSTFDSFNFGGNVGMNHSGLLLTSGDATPPLQNTMSNYSQYLDVTGDAMLENYIQSIFPGAGATYDASVLEFSFTVTQANIQSISFDLMFGSDEYPEYTDSSFVDIAALFVNGENYAYFDEDISKPLSIVGNTVDSGRLYANDNGQYAIEYDGISPVITVNVPVTVGETYDIRIGVADTGDNAFDSALFVSNFTTSTTDNAGSYVQVVAGNEGGTFTAPAEGTGTLFISGTGQNTFIGSTSKDVYNLLNGGQNTLQGNIEQLKNDQVLGFGDDDKLLITELEITENDYEVIMGSAIINIDTDKDGIKESTITLLGDYENAEFSFINTAEGVEISFVETAQPDKQGTALLTNLIDQLGLTGLSQGVTLAVGARFDQMEAAGFFSDAQLAAVFMANPSFVSAFANQGVEGFGAIMTEVGNAKSSLANVELTGIQGSSLDDMMF